MNSQYPADMKRCSNIPPCPNRVDILKRALSESMSAAPAMVKSHTHHHRVGEIMGWIVRDACNRLYAQIGRYHWDEWGDVATALGLTVAIVNHGPVPPACLVGRTIIIRGGLDAQTTAFLAYHELGHHVLHAGDPAQWRQWFGGAHLMAKYERQASEFAEEFPVWE